MPYLSPEDLSGFLHVGPHHYPRRTQGAQIIRRGPHGKRLAADPVKSRSGQPRGSGFRFWVEQLNVKPDVRWNPKQEVTGVMGMGSMGDLSGAISRTQQVISRHGANPARICALDNTNAPLFQEIAAEAFPSGGSIDDGIVELRAVVRQIKGDGPVAVSAQAVTCLARWQAGTVGGNQADRRIGDLNILHRMIINQRGRVRVDGTPMIAPDTIDPRTGKFIPMTQEEYCRRNPSACFPEDECSWYDVPCLMDKWWDEKWGKIALAGAGILVVYGLAKGFGSGLARRGV